MKVEKAEAKFSPVVITLESQEEHDLFAAIFANISGTGKLREIVDQVYYSLEDGVHKRADELVDADEYAGSLRVRSYN